MRRRTSARLAGTVIALVLTGASVSAFPWIRDMWVGPVVLPGTMPMTPPEDVLPVDGQPVMNRIDARDKLRNPRTMSQQVAEEGAELYRIYCATCHGAEGGGDGPVASHFRRMPPLTTPNVQSYADGWIYSIIRDGGFNMPPLGASLSIDERWAVVHHLRTFAPEP